MIGTPAGLQPLTPSSGQFGLPSPSRPTCLHRQARTPYFAPSRSPLGVYRPPYLCHQGTGVEPWGRGRVGFGSYHEIRGLPLEERNQESSRLLGEVDLRRQSTRQASKRKPYPTCTLAKHTMALHPPGATLIVAVRRVPCQGHPTVTRSLSPSTMVAARIRLCNCRG